MGGPDIAGGASSAAGHCVTLKSPKINNGEAFKYTPPFGGSDDALDYIIRQWVEDHGGATLRATVTAKLESGQDLDTKESLAVNGIGLNDVVCVDWQEPQDKQGKPRRGRKQSNPRSSA